MDCYLNDKNMVYIGVGQSGEDAAYNGFITLDKEDVQKMVKILNEALEQMTDEQ